MVEIKKIDKIAQVMMFAGVEEDCARTALKITGENARETVWALNRNKKILTLYRLSLLKRAAFFLGKGVEGKDYKGVFQKFWDDPRNKSLKFSSARGKQWEVVFCFLAGIFAREFRQQRKRFFVETDERRDRHQIDVEINGSPIQLKIGHSERRCRQIQILLDMRERNVKIFNIPFPKYVETEGGEKILNDDVAQEFFMEVLAYAGVQVDVNNLPEGFDAVSDLWQWFAT